MAVLPARKFNGITLLECLFLILYSTRQGDVLYCRVIFLQCKVPGKEKQLDIIQNVQVFKLSEREELATHNWPAKTGLKWMYSPRTVRKALVVLTGMVKSEQVYWPSSDRLTSLILMVSSCHEARTSSILLSLRAADWRRAQRITKSAEKKEDRNTVTAGQIHTELCDGN